MLATFFVRRWDFHLRAAECRAHCIFGWGYRENNVPAFISFSAKDEAIYSAVCLALDGAGVERWDHETMSRGDPLADQLRMAISSCEVCAFIATRRSIESQWCLAEVGAFWGAGKRVLLFIADPDLDDSVLPPQFKGNLKVKNASELISSIKAAIKQHHAVHENIAYTFFETSGDYGTETEWKKLLENAKTRFDVLGVALGSWRRTSGFSKLSFQSES
jgi:TIR domain-containing protein